MLLFVRRNAKKKKKKNNLLSFSFFFFVFYSKNYFPLFLLKRFIFNSFFLLTVKIAVHLDDICYNPRAFFFLKEVKVGYNNKQINKKSMLLFLTFKPIF